MVARLSTDRRDLSREHHWNHGSADGGRAHRDGRPSGARARAGPGVERLGGPAPHGLDSPARGPLHRRSSRASVGPRPRGWRPANPFPGREPESGIRARASPACRRRVSRPARRSLQGSAHPGGLRDRSGRHVADHGGPADYGSTGSNRRGRVRLHSAVSDERGEDRGPDPGRRADCPRRRVALHVPRGMYARRKQTAPRPDAVVCASCLFARARLADLRRWLGAWSRPTGQATRAGFAIVASPWTPGRHRSDEASSTFASLNRPPSSPLHESTTDTVPRMTATSSSATSSPAPVILPSHPCAR